MLEKPQHQQLSNKYGHCKQKLQEETGFKPDVHHESQTDIALIIKERLCENDHVGLNLNQHVYELRGRGPAIPNTNRQPNQREERPQEEEDLERRNPCNRAQPQTETLRNHNNEEEPRDPLLVDQGIPLANTNNAITTVNPPLAPVVINDVVVPTNIAVVAALPTSNQAALASNPILLGGVNQENLLRALRMIEQQRNPIYKLHGTSPFTEEVRQARLP
uniref:Uncharacterized protein n=1 Tax=Cannabis sativa TaxID=3483 RepID=A0A803NHD7_CANSA